MSAGRGCGDEPSRFDVELFFVGVEDLVGDGLGVVGFDEGDGGSAEASAGHSGAEDVGAAEFDGVFDESVDFGCGDFEVVAHGVVRLDHELADGGPVFVVGGVGGVEGALVFGDDVACAFVDGGIELGLFGVEVFHGGVAQSLDAQLLCGGFACLATFGVVSVDEGVFDFGVDDEDGDVGVIECDLAGFVGSAVDEEGVTVLAHGGDELVHDAAGHAGVFVFGFLAEQCLADGVEFEVGECFAEGGGGDLEGGGGGESCAGGDIGDDDGVESGDGEFGIEDACEDAPDVVGPGGLALGDGLVEGDDGLALEVGGSDASGAVFAGFGGEDGVSVEGEG